MRRRRYSRHVRHFEGVRWQMSALGPKADIAKAIFEEPCAYCSKDRLFVVWLRNLAQRELVGLVDLFFRGPLLLQLSFFFFAQSRRGRTMLCMNVCASRHHCYVAQAHGPSHSITSSARASNVSGTFKPIALAVFRLITRRFFVGVCTARLEGFHASGCERHTACRNWYVVSRTAEQQCNYIQSEQIQRFKIRRKLRGNPTLGVSS